MTRVKPWVVDLVEDVFGGSPLVVGKKYRHPKHGIITITSGQYWGTHGISNHWHWTDGEGNDHHGYGASWPEVTERSRRGR